MRLSKSKLSKCCWSLRLSIVLILIIICNSINFISCDEKGKPYEMTIDKLEPFTNTEKEYIDFGTVRIARKGRNNFVITGDFEVKQNIGDESTLKYSVYKMALNGIYEKIMEKSKPLCKLLQENTDLYPEVAKKSNLPYPCPCPFPKDTYTINDFSYTEESLPDVVPIGQYKLQLEVILNGQILFGMSSFGTVS